MPALPVTQQITFLDTDDLARTAEFYEGVLGLRLARDQGSCRIYHVCAGAYLGFCQRDPVGGGSLQGEPSQGSPSPSGSSVAPRGAAGVTVLTLITDDVDEWYRRLEARGVEIVKPPADNPPYRIYNAFARDPNGYLIEIQRFWEPLE
jgi:catechol 2,3-dioxygenase-like lactoylglutathione lyase family enzyme